MELHRICKVLKILSRREAQRCDNCSRLVRSPVVSTSLTNASSLSLWGDDSASPTLCSWRSEMDVSAGSASVIRLSHPQCYCTTITYQSRVYHAKWHTDEGD